MGRRLLEGGCIVASCDFESSEGPREKCKTKRKNGAETREQENRELTGLEVEGMSTNERCGLRACWLRDIRENKLCTYIQPFILIE